MQHDYFGRLCVLLDEPVEVPPEPVPSFVETESAMIPLGNGWEHAIGYYVDVGFRCQPGDIVDVIDLAAEDGEVHWGRSEWHETHLEALPQQVRQRVALNGEAVWYRGEREYFSRW